MDSERNAQAPGSQSPIWEMAATFGVVMARLAIGMGFLVCICAAIYGFVCFKTCVRAEERAYLLTRAAYYNDVDLVRGLLRIGVDPNHLDRGGNTPLDMALYRRATASVRILRASGAVEGLSSWRRQLLTYDFEEED